MLYLNAEDIRKAISYEDMMDTIEEALRLFAKGEYLMADRLAVNGGDTTMLYMPCFAAGVAGTKILASCPNNPQQGLPALSGIVLLNRADNGQIEAILDGTTLTALRTGAVGGVAARHLSPADAHTLGVVGCGVQGLHQLLYICRVRPIDTVYLYHHRGKDLSDFISKAQQLLPQPVQFVVCSSADELLSNSEIVVTATPSKQPLFSNDEALFAGKCIIAVGSWQPEMREIPEAIWSCVTEVYTELPFACEESGDLSQPLASGALRMEQVKYLGDLLLQKQQGAELPPPATCYFKSVGMGIYDTMAAKQIYQTAVKLGIGQKLS